MSRKLGFLAAFLISLVTNASAWAAPMLVGPGAFSPGDTVINFAGIGAGTLITNQFSPQGVFFGFNPGLFGNPAAGPTFGAPGAASNAGGVNPTIMAFTPSVTQVGFSFLGHAGDQIRVTAYSAVGVVTGTFIITATGAPQFIGVADPNGMAFVNIRDLSNAGGVYSFTNLTFGSPATAVPEPASLAIWSAMGLVGLGVKWRNRRQASASV